MPPTMMTYSSGTPALVGYDGGATELTDEAYRTMRMVLRVVQGVGDGSEEADPYVSTGQAAEILGVSARTVARYLDAGDIPCERRGTGHRRARLSDVLAYKETRSARATELARMREEAADGGLYDLDLSDQMFAHFEGERK